jgi:two-component system, chemotaxis family, protein-glutamate methylesterase/glutaminase
MEKIIVIGASTGGPGELAKLMGGLPVDLMVPVLITQHMPAKFTTSLAVRLDSLCPLAVSEAKDGELIQASRAYVVPGDYHFFFEAPGPVVHLLSAAEGLSPSVDMGMISAVDHYGPGVIGVVLSGMGNDGLVGARAIKQIGGVVIAESQESAAIYGMPKEVIEAKLADEVLQLSQIAPRLIELVNDGK